MPRGDGLARQLQLMQILEKRQEIAVPAVAAELGYTERTVYRDLQVLERIGVRLYQEQTGRQRTVPRPQRSLAEHEPPERLVDPYQLHAQAGAMYLIGFCHQRNAIRTFALDRIVEAERTGALFAARAPFAASALLQGALG